MILCKLLVKELDHTGYFFHDLWFGDMDKSAPGALTNALLWEQSHSNNKLIHEVPEHPKKKYGNTQLRTKYQGGYLKECAVFGSAP